MQLAGRTSSPNLIHHREATSVRCHLPPHSNTGRESSRARRPDVQSQDVTRGKANGSCNAAGTNVAASSTTTSSSTTSSTVDYFAVDKRPIILFDGVCNMCNGGVNFVLDWDKQGVYRFAALQSNPGRQLLVRCGRQPDDISSIVLVEESSSYIKSNAVLRIATRLGMPWPLLAGLAFLTPRFIRDPLYDQVAANRYSVFGKTNSCRMTDDGFRERFLGA